MNPAHTYFICGAVQRAAVFPSLFPPRTDHSSIERLLCCVAASQASTSSNQSCLFTGIAVVRFVRIGTFNTWDRASLEDDLISRFPSRSLCGPVRASKDVFPPADKS